MPKKKDSGAVAPADMTPMIDMVFQLLIFFILMFKIVDPEGDFSIKMPIGGGPGDGPPPTSIIVRLHANSSGHMTDMGIGAHVFRNDANGNGIREMRNYVRQQLGSNGPVTAAATKIELDCDYNLRYENVVKIISVCTGYVENGRVVRMAEKIEFRAPRAQN